MCAVCLLLFQFLEISCTVFLCTFRRTSNTINVPDFSNRIIASEVKFHHLCSLFYCIASHFNGLLLRLLRAIYCACRYNSYADIKLWNFLFHSELTNLFVIFSFIAIIVLKMYLTFGPPCTDKKYVASYSMDIFFFLNLFVIRNNIIALYI